jgi:SulP family sulfate permease
MTPDSGPGDPIAGAGTRHLGWLRLRTLLPQRSDWSGVRPRHDLIAGSMVGLVALPLALGFGVSSGLGAEAGLVTAIIAGVVAAVFGGSRVQVSGPTGAMAVILVPIVAVHGRDGVLVVGLLAGMILIGLGIAGAGRVMRYVPVPVVEGFTAGIAVIIALQQVPSALGVDVHAEKVLVLGARAVRLWVDAPHWLAPLMCVGVAGLILVGARVRPAFPAGLFALVLATLGNAVFGWGVAEVGHLPSGLPAPSLPSIPWAQLDQLILPAVAVAALAGLESLLSATVADAMTVGRRHDPDRELVGQGLANIAVPLFGGIPATAAIARTAVNVRSGAVSRLASVVHALVLLAAVLVAAGWVGRIPLAALAGVLIATAIQMVEVSSVRALLRATRGDAAVLCVTFGATVLFDLVTAVVLGLVLAGFIALREVARAGFFEQLPLDAADHEVEERTVLEEHVVVYRLDGPLFFAAAHDFLLGLSQVSDVRVVVLRMSRVTTIDATGATLLGDTIRRLEGRGIRVLLSGLRPLHAKVLRELGVLGPRQVEPRMFATTAEAIRHARTLAN